MTRPTAKTLRRPSYAELEAKVALMEEQMTAMEAARWFDRFHALDGIKDDACPCCGGRIVVEEAPTRIQDGVRLPQGVRLRAVPWS